MVQESPWKTCPHLHVSFPRFHDPSNDLRTHPCVHGLDWIEGGRRAIPSVCMGKFLSIQVLRLSNRLFPLHPIIGLNLSVVILICMYTGRPAVWFAVTASTSINRKDYELIICVPDGKISIRWISPCEYVGVNEQVYILPIDRMRIQIHPGLAEVDLMFNPRFPFRYESISWSTLCTRPIICS